MWIKKIGSWRLSERREAEVGFARACRRRLAGTQKRSDELIQVSRWLLPIFPFVKNDESCQLSHQSFKPGDIQEMAVFSFPECLS